MAIEINDLKGIFILVLFAIPMVTSTNINCSGRAFHCVNSTHFMICVDLGGGLSTTIDDFVIPCPATTVCHENNVFECDFPEVTTPPLQVIGVYKQSDTIEPTSVTNSVTAPTPLSEIFSVFKENITATTLKIPEDVTPIVKVEVLENIKDPVGDNSENTTEASFKVTSNFTASTNEVVNDKQTSNMTLTTSATDNNKHLEPAVETSIHTRVNISSTDKSMSIDTVTSVIGLINLISTDLPSVVYTNPSSDVLTSLDTLYDNIATTTEQYITKQVTIHGEKVKNVTEKIIIPTEVIFNERSVTKDKVSMTPVVNTYIESDKNNKSTEFINKIDSGNQTIAVGNFLVKTNDTSELVPETTTEYLAPISIVNISETVTVDPSPQTTTDNTFVPVGLVDFISVDPKQNAPSTNDYINTFYGNTATKTTDQNTTILETTLRDKPVTTEVISTTPIINTIVQNVLKNNINYDFLTELNPTAEIISMKKVPEQNINYLNQETITIDSLKTTTEKTFVPINTEADIMSTTETTPKSGDLIKNDSLVEKHTTATQPATDSLIESTDNLYQINREMNETIITAKNNTTSTINTTERVEVVFNASSTDIVNNQVTEPTLLPPITLKNPAIELTTAETLQNGFTPIEVKYELRATNAPIIVNELYVENVKNDTLMYNTINTMNTTVTVKTEFNASSTDIINGKSTEPSTIKYPTIEISTAETLQNGFTAHAIEAKNELPATNGPMSVNEYNLENVGINTLLSVHTTPAPYNVVSDSVTNTTGKDFISQSDIVTNPQIGFTAEIIAHKSSDGFAFIDPGTTQKVTTDPKTKIPGSLNQSKNLGMVSLPENLKADRLTKTVVDKDVVGMTTTYWKNVENSTTTSFPSNVTGKNNLSDSVKSVNQDNISATNVGNAQDVLIKTVLPQAPSTVYYVSELASTTPITVQTTPISTDTTKISEQVSSYNPEIVDIYRASTTGYKIYTSTTLPVDVTHKTNIENVTDIPVTTQPPQESTSQQIGTVKQLNTTSTTTETVSDPLPFTVTTTEYVVLNSTNLNTSSWKDSVIIDTVSSKVGPHADVNKTETVKPINVKDSKNATSPSSTIKDVNITIVSVFDNVNSSENVMPNEALQPTSSNDYSKTTESQDSSAYVTATDNVPDNNLVQAGELVIQKNPEGIKSFAQTNVMNSIVSTPSTLPITEIHTEKVQYVGTEIPIPSTVDLKHINPTKTAVEYVTEKTNDYISSTEAILTKPNVKTESSVSSVRMVTSGIAVTPDGFTTVPVHNEVTTIKDNAFIMSSTQISPKVMTDNNIRLSTESPSLASIAMQTQTFKHNTESSLPISELPVAQMTTEPTHSIEVLTQTTPLAAIGKTNQDVMSTVNNNTPQSMPPLHLLPIVGLTAAQITTEPTPTTNVFAQITPLDEINQDVLPGIKAADLTQNVMSTLNNNIPQSMASLPIVGVSATQITTEHTLTSNVFAQTTALEKMNQDVLPRIKTADLPQHVTSTVNNNVPQSMVSLPIVGLTAVQMTTEPTRIFITNVFAQTTPLDKMNQDVLPGTKTADLPQHVISTVNNNIPQSMASLPIVGVTAAQMTTEPTRTFITNVYAQTTPLGKMNQDVSPGTKTADLPQYVMSTLNKNTPQSMASPPIEGLTAAQTTTKSTHTTNVFAQTTSLLAAAGKTNQDVPSGIKTTDLPQDVTTTVRYNNTQWVSDITTEIITDSLTVPDSMVETIKVVGDKVSATYFGETALSDVMSNNPTFNNTNYSVKSVKNIIDHESIVVGATSKNNEQNNPLSAVKPVDINKAEIVNHTESNWMRSDVNIDSVKTKESSIEEDPISSVLKSGTDVQNKTFISDTSIIPQIETKDGISADNIEYKRLITVTTNYKEAESGVPNNVTQSKKIITKQNKNAEIDSTVNANIEIIDVKRFQVQVESKKISDGYNINNTKANITTSQHNLSLQKSTINDELEQHLMSTNHTITTEVQNHLNENDKQSNKTSDEPTLNGTRMYNSNLTSIKLNAGNNDTSPITVSTLVFNCSIRGKYADKKDCRKFYTCIGYLQPILGTCPNNTVFSEINKQCTRNLSHCVRNNQFRCLLEGRFSDFFKDNIYYICVKNRMNGFIRYKIQCQDNYHLNKDSVKCEKNEEISTQSASSVSETNDDESKPQPKSAKLVSTDDFECENEGKFPYVKNCSKYYVCNNIKNVYYICVKNRLNGFIRYKLQCQDDYHLNKDLVKCEKNEEISTQSASSVSEMNNDESKPQPKSEKLVSTDDFECENEGTFPYAKDCSKYYVCTKIKNVYRRKIKKCASEEVFDKNKKKCVESDSGEC